ncbi:hypothetical protein [Rufibacter roseolus]|uniref:hypothetical protein n=1 Tax=Rufibacter roseolus TaxID=2817375 RepID=UPI001B30AFDE|nr:hypothetical protein [Rufibacter roseolus]
MTKAEDSWNEVKKKFKIGDEVEGIVVHKAPFGDFIDLGVEFLALLEVIVVKDLTPEKYRKGLYNPIGSKIQAYIVSFEDSNQQIRLAQNQLD